MPLNKIKLNIAGSSYTINSMDPEDHLVEIAKILDQDIKDVLENTPSASVTAAAVLCALTYLDKLEKSSKGADNMRLQIKQYLEEANKARYEAEKVKVEMEKLKVDIQYLKNQRGQNG